ncbi:hypothetical protein ACFFUT_17105 [Pseudohalocynthiibacter aestuariivivens]|uniref:Terminase small subunit n=1 Tax=Pseudohalocynthiibacter aestuariivivens TaxID=1591409 RepID=A0ABV5JJ92_9RHOB|nr:hypothetical protein [Pseudohalocynthiibacter aestuariivivens]MBS9716743.1 hypothetical protein [Pseudohalocynthiibacter aestuariivivens]
MTGTELGSTPLKNTKHEQICRIAASGDLSRTAIYQKVFGSGRNSAQLAYKVFHRPDVIARVAYLRRERAASLQIDETAHTRDSLVDTLNNTITDLRFLAELCERNGLDSDSANLKTALVSSISKMKSRLDALQSIDEADTRVSALCDAPVVPSLWCQCHHG